MQCAKCGQNVSRIRAMLGHTCRQIPKLGPAFADSRTEPWGRGTEWMPESYGQYYAKFPAVYAAVKQRGDAATVPTLRIYQRTSTGERTEIQPNHPLRVLMDSVNPWWTGGDLMRATSIYLDLWGSAFWVLKKTPGGAPTEIFTVRPDHMRVVPSQARYIDGYWYQAPNGKRIALRTDEVIWFRHFNPLDEYAGLSPIAAARLSIDMGHEGLQHNRNIFKNGMLWGNVALAAKDGSGFTEEQAREFRDSLKARYTKPENSHLPLIMGNFDAKNLGITNRDMEFIAALRWSLEDVARVYFTPLPMLGDLERATYENINAAERIFWRSGMVPQLKLISDGITEHLCPMFGENLEAEFDLSEINALQEDAGAVAARNVADVSAGLMTINEVREQRGLEPVPWGDVWWAPFGLQPIESPEDAQPQVSPFGAPGSDEQGDEQPQRRFPTPVRRALWAKHQESRISDTFVVKILELHDRGLTKGESEFLRMQRGLFEQQEREILRHVTASQNGVLTSEVKALPGIDLFNLDDWVRRFIKVAGPVYGALAASGAQQQINAFSLNVSFDLRKIQPWIDQRTQFWSSRVNEETARMLLLELQEGIAAQEGIKELQRRVKDVFAFANDIRAERIARTETQAILNEAAVESYRQSGVVERKMWLATLDSRTRDAHIEAHRQVVELETNFLVGGEAIAHPGEGSPENAINCRCTVAPIVTQRAWQPPIEQLLNGRKTLGG